MIPVVLAIGGSDSSGGAGIQADIRTIEAWRAWPASVVTAVTAQNTRGVRAVAALDAELVREQMEAVFDDMNVIAVKTGMLATADVVRVVAEVLRERRPPHVVGDPVLASGGGEPLLEKDALAAVRDELLPVLTLVTPNVSEAARLTGIPIHTAKDAERAGVALRARGASSALITGGHLESAPGTDVLADADGTMVFPPEWIQCDPIHGTGCVTASALASALALGQELRDAVGNARTFVRHAIRGSVKVGEGDRCLVPGAIPPATWSPPDNPSASVPAPPSEDRP